jgi:hypothetical protein
VGTGTKNLRKSTAPLTVRNSQRWNDSKRLEEKNKTTTRVAKKADPEFAREEQVQHDTNNLNLPASKAEEGSPRPNDGSEDMKHVRVRIFQLIGRADKLGEQMDLLLRRPAIPSRFGSECPRQSTPI